MEIVVNNISNFYYDKRRVYETTKPKKKRCDVVEIATSKPKEEIEGSFYESLLKSTKDLLLLNTKC